MAAGWIRSYKSPRLKPNTGAPGGKESKAKNLKLGVTAVAQSWAGSVFASAEVHGLGLGSFELYGREFASFVAAIAKGLLRALAAGTPEVGFARFNFYGVRGLLCDRWF